jgi:hypothetical protein
MAFRTIKLVVESETVPDATGYDPCPGSVPGSSNPQTVQNQDDKDEQWYLDIEDDVD